MSGQTGSSRDDRRGRHEGFACPAMRADAGDAIGPTIAGSGGGIGFANRLALERKLLMWMRCLHDRWHGLLGYRRMHAMLETEGFDAPLRLVRRLMKDNEMSGRPSGRRSRYKSKARRPAAADLLRRDFTADAPNCRWVSDLSEFETAEGKLHLGMVKDLYDGTIVGHKMGDRQTREAGGAGLVARLAGAPGIAASAHPAFGSRSAVHQQETGAMAEGARRRTPAWARSATAPTTPRRRASSA